MTKEKSNKLKAGIIATVISTALIATGVGLILTANDNEEPQNIATISGKITTDNASGKHIANVYVYNSDDLDKVIIETQTAENGTFSIEVNDFTNNNYTVVISKNGYLKQTIKNVLMFEGVEADLGLYTLIAGDIDGSGEIELDDLVTLNNNYGKTNNVCDLNEDGVVDTIDRELLKSNYSKIASIVNWENPIYKAKRKTNVDLADLFNITDEENVKYEVTGNLNFKNQEFTSNELTNVSDLEMGTYEVKCTVTNSNGIKNFTTKQIDIIQLADTTFSIGPEQFVDGYAIYTEYDLAYFRDMVNNGQSNINGQLMNDIVLTNVSSQENGGWIPIGYWDGGNGWVGPYYEGLFYGSNNGKHKITIKSLADVNSESKHKNAGLFGMIIGGTVRYLTVDGNISINGDKINYVGAIAGCIKDGNILDCNNKCLISGNLGNDIGGIVGSVQNSYISGCKNNESISAEASLYVGGIAGRVYDYSTISLCENNESIYGKSDVGGIVGQLDNLIIQSIVII